MYRFAWTKKAKAAFLRLEEEAVGKKVIVSVRAIQASGQGTEALAK